MKFTAEFDSVNSADLAAAAIRQNISSFYDISVTENRSRKSYTANKNLHSFSSYNPSVSQYIFSFPVSTDGIYSNTIEDMNETELRSDATLQVICRGNDRKKISAIIIGYGGREISLTD